MPIDLLSAAVGYLLGRATGIFGGSVPVPGIPGGVPVPWPTPGTPGWPGGTPPPTPPPGGTAPGGFPPKGPSGLPIPQPFPGGTPPPNPPPPKGGGSPAPTMPQPTIPAGFPTTFPTAPPDLPIFTGFPGTGVSPPPSAGRQYQITDGDAAAYVAMRFNNGQAQRPDGSWIWKELSGSNPDMNTSGPLPSPWVVGQRINLPSSWGADMGPRPQAQGSVWQAGMLVSGYDDDYGPDDQLLTV